MDMNIGNRLDEAMKDAKIVSQSQLARSSGVPQPTINRILKGQGKQGPETSTLISLARALSVEVRWLQTGAGPKRAGEAERPLDTAGNDASMQQASHAATPLQLLQWVSPSEAEFLSELRARDSEQQRRLLNALKRMPRLIVDLPGRDKA